MQMVAYRTFLIGLALLLVSCAEDSIDLPEEPKKISNPVLGTWQYVDVEVEGIHYPFANLVMEPGFNKSGLGGERAELERRRIQYFADGTYELKWVDRGDYQLGTDGDPNWQPSYGNYRLSAEEDSLYHNKGLDYEVAYTLSRSGDTLMRRHRRYMSKDGFNGSGVQVWWVANRRNYTETFVRVSN